jgi:hypothetical protein
MVVLLHGYDSDGDGLLEEKVIHRILLQFSSGNDQSDHRYDSYHSINEISYAKETLNFFLYSTCDHQVLLLFGYREKEEDLYWRDGT